MSHAPAQPQAPRDPRLKDGWRAAAAAYRKAYGGGCADEAYKAATAALHAVVPELSDREAMLETVAAVHYASVIAPNWLYALYLSMPRTERFPQRE